VFQYVGYALSRNNSQQEQSSAERQVREQLAQVFSSYLDILSDNYPSVAREDLNKLGSIALPEAKIVERWRYKMTNILFMLIQLDMSTVKSIVANSNDIDEGIKSFIQKNGDEIFDNLAKEKRQMEMAKLKNLELSPLESVRKAGCMACHKIEGKLIGPAFSWMSFKYKNNKEQGKKEIIDQISNGGHGEWTRYTGGIFMPPSFKKLTEAQLNELADYILSIGPVSAFYGTHEKIKRSNADDEGYIEH
jgi:cytochrome c